MASARKIYVRNASHSETVGAGETVEIYVLAEKGAANISVRHVGSDSRSALRVAGVAETGRVDVRMELSVDAGLSNVEASQDARIITAGGAASVTPAQDIRSEGAKARHGASISGITDADAWPLALAGIGRAEAEEMIISSLRASVLDTARDAC
jgi:Fe-S cluster assembly scaffold protein SufB